MLDNYKLFREAVRFQNSRCDRLEKKIAADRELAKSFVAYAKQKYNSLRLELEDARKLVQDYRMELGSVDDTAKGLRVYVLIFSRRLQLGIKTKKNYISNKPPSRRNYFDADCRRPGFRSGCFREGMQGSPLNDQATAATISKRV